MGSVHTMRRPLKIKGAFTWHNGPYELFDYDNNNQAETIMYPEGSGYLQRKSFELQFVTHQEEGWDTLFEVEEGPNSLIRIRDQNKSKQEGELLWMVLQPKNSFVLHQGDMLKLGKIVLVVKDIVLAGNQNELTLADARAEINLDYSEVQSAKSGISRKTNNLPQCKVCFGQHDTLEDPLITPCLCTGSLGSVHLDCLKGWLQNKITRRVSDISYSYHWNKLKCEICGGTFEQAYEKNGVRYELSPFMQKPEPPYLVLESHKTRGNLNQQQQSSIVYITKLEENFQIRIGRDNSQHIRISDISVSRSHCTLTLTEGNLVVSDKHSKFGTLARLKMATRVPTDSLSLQYGSTNIQISREVDLLGCCLQCIESQEFELFGH